MTDINISRPAYGNGKPLDALRGAAAAYGVSLPATVTAALDRQAEVTALVRSVPEADHDLGRAVLFGDDVEQAVAEAAEEKNRRDAIRAMNNGNALVNLVRGAVAESLSDAYGDLWSSVRKAVEKDVATLTKQAGNLPAGNAVLDPASILRQKGGAAAFAAVEPVLDKVDVLLDAMPRPRADVARSLPASVARTLWLVSVPEVEPQTKVGPWEADHSSDESQAQRKVLHAFRTAVEDDARAALVGVARGEFPGLSLDVAGDAETVVERARRFAVSQVVVKKREGDRDRPSGVLL